MKFKMGDWVECYIDGHGVPTERLMVIGETSYSCGNIFMLARERAIGMPCNGRNLTATGEEDYDLAVEYRERFEKTFPGAMKVGGP